MFVSIGLPFYNAELFLKDSIRSVFAQTHNDWELILLDDGSSDNSLSIAREINDPRVRVFSDGENKKLAARLNEIAQIAKYDIVVRMDADDLMSPNRIEKQLSFLKEDQTLDLVTSGLYSISDNLELKGVRWHHSTSISFNDLLFKNGCGVVHAAIMARKSWLLRNPYDESLLVAQDYDLWIKAASKNDFNIHLIQEPLYYYREDGNINVNKMKLARQYERELYRRFVEDDFLNKFSLLTRSHLKSIGIYVLSSLNMLDVLRSRRNKVQIDSKLKAKFENEIKLIKQIELI